MDSTCLKIREEGLAENAQIEGIGNDTHVLKNKAPLEEPINMKRWKPYKDVHT